MQLRSSDNWYMLRVNRKSSHNGLTAMKLRLMRLLTVKMLAWKAYKVLTRSVRQRKSEIPFSCLNANVKNRYKLAEKLSDRMNGLNKDLTDMIDEINGVSAQLSKTKSDDPVSLSPTTLR